MKRVIHHSLRVALPLSAILILPSAAFAHPMKGVGDFYAGMLHPAVSIEMILPLIAIGLLSGQQSRDTAIKLLAALPAAVLMGTLLILFKPVPPFLGTLDLVITAVVGLLIALAKPLYPLVPISLAVLLGVALGWANAAEITPDISPVRFVAGLALAGLLLVTYGVGLVRGFKFEWSQTAVRVVGSWLAAIGILVLGLR